MIKFKPNVDFRNMSSQVLLAIIVADQCNKNNETVITSISDSAAGRAPNSLHNKGLAVDLRTKNNSNPEEWRNAIAKILGQQFDVILEHKGKQNEHIHIEFDPDI